MYLKLLEKIKFVYHSKIPLNKLFLQAFQSFLVQLIPISTYEYQQLCNYYLLINGVKIGALENIRILFYLKTNQAMD